LTPINYTQIWYCLSMKKIILKSVSFGILLVGIWAVIILINNNQNKENVDSKKQLEVSSNTIKNLSNQGLKSIPMYIFEDKNIEELDISNNQIIGSIQAEIRNLSQLKIINASNNIMTGIPAEIGWLKNLEIIDFSNNQITGLPYELGNLKNLKVLNLSGNNYSKQDLEIIKKNLSPDVTIITE
jgi:Leucine-rich repeat (LRR) protein